MPQTAAHIESRLPTVGTTIFTVMSRLAAEAGAINLSQGFPDFSPDPLLFELVSKAMRAGFNQYAPMAGVVALREAIGDKVAALYGASYDPDSEITVTAGATQALFTAIAALVRPADEVVVFEPVYDSYIPAIELNGGRVRRARLVPPHYRPDWSEVAKLVSPRTRLIIVNTPHNPTGSVWQADDMAALVRITQGSNIVVLADEVYEHIVFDGARHASCAGSAELAARSLIVSSFGKTYHITGWKIGYCLGPRELMAEFRKVHQFNVFAVHAPAQHALAEFMREPSRHLALAGFYQGKRDYFRSALAATRFELLPCAGTYFQSVRYGHLSDEPDARFAERLTRQFGVAAIPVSAFYGDKHDERVLRLCFAKGEETLARAGERLARV